MYSDGTIDLRRFMRVIGALGGVGVDRDVEGGVDVELWIVAKVEFSVIVAKGNIPNLIFQSIEVVTATMERFPKDDNRIEWNARVVEEKNSKLVENIICIYWYFNNVFYFIFKHWLSI